MPQTQGPSSNQLRKSIGNIIYKSIDHFICLIKKKYQIFAGFRRIYTYKSKTILIKYCRLTDYEKNTSAPFHISVTPQAEHKAGFAFEVNCFPEYKTWDLQSARLLTRHLRSPIPTTVSATTQTWNVIGRGHKLELLVKLANITF